MDEWRLDTEEAARYASQHPRFVAPGCKHEYQLVCRCEPPHWVRCEWMCGGERCRFGAGHLQPHAVSPSRT